MICSNCGEKVNWIPLRTLDYDEHGYVNTRCPVCDTKIKCTSLPRLEKKQGPQNEKNNLN